MGSASVKRSGEGVDAGDFAALLRAGGVTVTPLAHEIGVQTMRQRDPEIDAPGSSQAPRTFALNSAP